jgi:hypothetical protein
MRAALAFLTMLGLSGVAPADTVALQNCRMLKDPAARLVCYDAIALPSTAVAAAGAGAPAAVPSVAPTAPAAMNAPSSAGLPTTVAVARPPPPTDRAATFGLESRALAASVDVLATSIVGPFVGWRPNGRIQLANGQVWQVTDGSEAAYDLRDPTVRITRGFAGTFFMEINGVSQTPRVRRLQ